MPGGTKVNQQSGGRRSSMEFSREKSVGGRLGFIGKKKLVNGRGKGGVHMVECFVM